RPGMLVWLNSAKQAYIAHATAVSYAVDYFQPYRESQFALWPEPDASSTPEWVQPELAHDAADAGAEPFYAGTSASTEATRDSDHAQHTSDLEFRQATAQKQKAIDDATAEKNYQVAKLQEQIDKLEDDDDSSPALPTSPSPSLDPDDDPATNDHKMALAK